MAARGQAAARRRARRAGAADPARRARARLKDAKRRLEEEHRVECEANAAYEAYRARGGMKDGRRFGGPPEPYAAAGDAGRARSISPTPTRATSRRRAGGCRATTPKPSCTEDQIVIAAEVTADSPDFGHLEPMVTATEAELAAAGITTRPHVVLADAGYWHQAQMDRLVDRGIGVLIPPDAGKRKGARPGLGRRPLRFMRRAARDRLRRRALRQTPGHDRAHLRRHEVQPRASTASNAAADPPAARNGA